MSPSGKLVNFQDQNADDVGISDGADADRRPQEEDAPDLEDPRLGRWSPTGPRSLMTSA